MLVRSGRAGRLARALAKSGRPGKGGITRGRGDAALGMTNETDGDTSAFEARRLPRGAVVPKTWERIGVSRVAPEVDPQRTEGAGGAGVEGTGEATWHRRLAPRHREAVRRYFGGTEEER